MLCFEGTRQPASGLKKAIIHPNKGKGLLHFWCPIFLQNEAAHSHFFLLNLPLFSSLRCEFRLTGPVFSSFPLFGHFLVFVPPPSPSPSFDFFVCLWPSSSLVCLILAQVKLTDETGLKSVCPFFVFAFNVLIQIPPLQTFVGIEPNLVLDFGWEIFGGLISKTQIPPTPFPKFKSHTVNAQDHQTSPFSFCNSVGICVINFPSTFDNNAPFPQIPTFSHFSFQSFGIFRQGNSQLRKAICHWKALNVLYKVAKKFLKKIKIFLAKVDFPPKIRVHYIQKYLIF